MAGFSETGGFIFMLSSLSFFVFQQSFWHIYVLSWAQAALLPYRLSIVSFSSCREELAFSREKGNTEAKKNEIRKGLCVSCSPPVYVSNLYWGQCFIQIDFSKLDIHAHTLQDGLIRQSVYSYTAFSSSP